MKKLLPTSTSLSVNKTKYNPQGFTLIELLVVIAIIAILSVVGIALFTNTQQKARDSKRIQDIAAISKALEANYSGGTGYSTSVSSAWFSDQAVPTNPNPGGATYASTNMTTSTYMLCATMETAVGNATSSTGGGLGTTSTGGYFCRRNSQ